ncbi:MAG: Asp23/Gls24 family envelope stress response protein [Clostridia bacterium]|nr:Asp23/Gls24 family envelope stress response protein [Clostridia bacterium]
MIEKQNNFGEVRISDEVISVVSSIAVGDVEGVVGIYDAGKTGLFGIKSASKGVSAEMKDNVISVDIDIVVKYGVKMQEVSWEIQSKVKNAVETMTGIMVQKVNVNVKGIEIPETSE